MEDQPSSAAWESPPPPTVERGGRTPWERDDASFPGDLFRSWMECMTRPSEFFARLDPDVSFARPFVFFLVFWIVGSGLAALSSLAVMGDWYADMYRAQGMAGPTAGWQMFMFFLSPFIGMLSLLLYVGLTHVGVLLFVRGGRRIGVTARGLCYVAAPLVLNIVPFVGWLVSTLWCLILAIVAVQQTHRTSFGRAVAAVIVPQVVVWFGLGLLFASFIVFVAAMVGGAA